MHEHEVSRSFNEVCLRRCAATREVPTAHGAPLPTGRKGDTIYISGQLSHRGAQLHAPAPTDTNKKVTDFSAMEEQMRQSYANAQELLRRFGASLNDVVEEVLYVLDVDAASAVAGPVRKAAYGREDPLVASTLVGTTRLTFPEQLVEIRFVAKV
jgi:enamine deaminase RidA (YjgF/YER057c/UK114 family)